MTRHLRITASLGPTKIQEIVSLKARIAHFADRAPAHERRGCLRSRYEKEVVEWNDLLAYNQ